MKTERICRIVVNTFCFATASAVVSFRTDKIPNTSARWSFRSSGARTAQAPQGVEFATKADLEALAARVDALAAPKTTAKKNAKEDAE